MTEENITNITYDGIGLGTLLAVLISYVTGHGLGWIILHGFLGWIYIIYYIIKFGFAI